MSEISDLARTIRDAYPKAATELAKDAKQLENLSGDLAYSALIPGIRHDYSAWLKCCQNWSMEVCRLAELVATELPDLFPTLRYVGSSDKWHDRKDMDWDAAERELRTIEAAAVPANQTPKTYLTSWREILQTLDLRNDEEERTKVKRLSDHYEGPIIVPGQGAQPKVERSRLLAWWNRLEIQFGDEIHQQRGKAANADAQHNYGRTGQAAPEIGGGVKKRRSDRKR